MDPGCLRICARPSAAAAAAASSRPSPGECRGERELRLVAEDRDGPREALGRPAQSPKAPEHVPGQRLRPELADPSGTAGGGLDALGEQRVDELGEQQGIAAAGRVNRAQEVGRGLGHERGSEKLGDALEAQRLGTHDGRQRLGLELGENGLVGHGLPRANRGGDDDGQAVESPCEVGDEAQRRQVRPVEVVDSHERRPALGDVDGQPVEAVQGRRHRIVMPGGVHTRPLELEQRRR